MTQVKNIQRRHNLVYKLHVNKVDLKHDIKQRHKSRTNESLKAGKELKYKYWENHSRALTREKA